MASVLAILHYISQNKKDLLFSELMQLPMFTLAWLNPTQLQRGIEIAEVTVFRRKTSSLMERAPLYLFPLHGGSL